MGKALYRKYRSRKLAEVVGQEHVTTLLANALKKGKIAHAYLFTGPRGVGKTSIARILAHEINNLPYLDDSSHLDIIEIDAASNNGVEDIRDLREKVNLTPTSAPKKVYIIDEVHMLSKPAFNALLKTLEEPPEHVVFILATTDVEKLPETIISRTQRYTFRRATEPDIIKNLTRIAGDEKVKIEPEALEAIARYSDGSFRDSVSLFDQLSSLGGGKDSISAKMVEQHLGLESHSHIEALITAVQARKLSDVTDLLKKSIDRGIQPRVLAEQIMHEIAKSANKHPELLPLLDELVGVNSSPLPHMKLLAVLGTYATPHSSEALAISTPTIEIEVEELPELAKKATEEHPSERLPVPESAPKEEPLKKTPQKRAKKSIGSFDESALRTYCDSSSIALASVIKHCGFAMSDDTLTIYASNVFYQKKLMAKRFSDIVHEGLETQGVDAKLDVLPSKKPSDNAQVAAIAAMMGGGEEVNIDE